MSPTYYGMAADVEGCAEIAHAAGAALIVDGAWGSHFGFHPACPARRCALGADAMLASTHKIVGSLTQSAMLLVAAPGAVDPEAVARAVRLIRSTSPSALLMASLDAARRQLAVHGEALLERTLARRRDAREAIDAVPGCAVLGEDFVGRPGIAGWDPLRIVIDVRGTGCTGYEVAAALRASYDIYVELATHATLVLVLGLDQPVERSSASPTTSPRPSGGSPGPAAPRDHASAGGARARDRGLPARRLPGPRRGRRRSRTRSGGSRASRSPATRPACPRSCPASASPTRWSPTCAS